MGNVYASRQEFFDLSVPSGSFDRSSVSAIDFALSSSSGLIDGFLRPQHSLPLTVVDPFLTYLCVVGASYQLIMSRGFAGDQGDEVITNNYLLHFGKDGTLDRMSKGHSPLLDASADATPNVPEGKPVVGTVQRSQSVNSFRVFDGCGRRFF